MADAQLEGRRSEPAHVAASPGLAPFCRALTLAGDDAGLRPLDRDAIEGALALFARRFREPEARPLASLWSMSYFDAVVVPAAAAALTLDRALPLALAGCRLRVDGDGLPAEVRLAAPSSAAAPSAAPDPFDALVEGHLSPFVELFAAATGVAPRLLWSNAAVALAFAIDRVAGAALPGPRAAVASLLDGGHAVPHLAGAFREDAIGERERVLCCGRRRLGGVAPCYTLCPERHVW